MIMYRDGDPMRELMTYFQREDGPQAVEARMGLAARARCRGPPAACRPWRLAHALPRLYPSWPTGSHPRALPDQQ